MEQLDRGNTVATLAGSESRPAAFDPLQPVATVRIREVRTIPEAVHGLNSTSRESRIEPAGWLDNQQHAQRQAFH